MENSIYALTQTTLYCGQVRLRTETGRKRLVEAMCMEFKIFVKRLMGYMVKFIYGQY
jgi:hypothetical protein